MPKSTMASGIRCQSFSVVARLGHHADLFVAGNFVHRWCEVSAKAGYAGRDVLLHNMDGPRKAHVLRGRVVSQFWRRDGRGHGGLSHSSLKRRVNDFRLWLRVCASHQVEHSGDDVR